VNKPGIQQVRRYYQHGKMIADMIYDIHLGTREKNIIFHPVDATKRKVLDEKSLDFRDLLLPVFRKGQKVYEFPGISAIKENLADHMKAIHSGIKRFDNPHSYPVGLEESLHKTKMDLILKLRKFDNT